MFGCASCRLIFNGCKTCRKEGYRGKGLEYYKDLQQKYMQESSHQDSHEVKGTKARKPKISKQGKKAKSTPK